MTTRCRNDLVGCKARITSNLNAWRESIETVQEIWNDATARSFYSENFTGLEETLSRMIVSIQEAADMVRSFERAVEDEEF
ncbi:MAG: hypothetical protein ACK6DC_14350 [Planctomycetota bacterium]|jgi:uncharacterized protein YukE